MSPTTIHSSAKLYKIGSIPGDGIGAEITEAAIQVLQKLAEASGNKFGFEFEHYDWSSKNFKERGYYIPEGPEGFEKLKKNDAIFFGAVGWPGTCN